VSAAALVGVGYVACLLVLALAARWRFR